jgi:hypothetical protein
MALWAWTCGGTELVFVYELLVSLPAIDLRSSKRTSFFKSTKFASKRNSFKTAVKTQESSLIKVAKGE